MSDFLIKNPANTALVTGASRGIGRAIAVKLARNGYNVVITCKSDVAGLHMTAADIRSAGRTCMEFVGDMGDFDTVSRMFTEIKAFDELSMPCVVVNNAGISIVGLFQDMSPIEWQNIISSNLTSVYNCCHFALPPMICARTGRIINISSVWGNVGASCEVAYSATKGAINSLTKALAKEMAPSHISVNAIACGAIDTGMNDHLTSGEKIALCEEIPAGRFGSPEEVADTVLMLCNAPEYMTGQIISVDGGWC